MNNVKNEDADPIIKKLLENGAKITLK